MVEESNVNCVINVEKWLKQNEESFKPPVCNSIMAGEFLKIMFVGGPNVRKDYHLDQGEEFFYMLKGDMCLKIIEQGNPKDIVIREGEVFLLPSRIPHSPQRKENTLGLVLERDRADQWDGVRYYCDDNKTILWQKYFHLHSLVQDFPPVIEEFFASEQYKTGKPIPGTTDEDEEKFKVDVHTIVGQPFLLNTWITDNRKEIDNGGNVVFGKGEFQITIYGKGKHDIQNPSETWLWVKSVHDGDCEEEKAALHAKNVLYEMDGVSSELRCDDSLIIPENKKITLEIEKCYLCIVFANDKNATPQS